MDHPQKDDVPILSSTLSHSAYNNHMECKLQKFTSGSLSDSISIPMNSIRSHENDINLVGHCDSLWNGRRTLTEASDNVNCELDSFFQQNQGVTSCNVLDKLSSLNGRNQNDWWDVKTACRNEHLMRSGQLGMCDDPYCKICPTCHNQKAYQANNSKFLGLVNPQFDNALYGDAKCLVTRLSSLLCSCIPGVMSPHAKVVQQWNRCFLIACLLAIFVDPLFFFLLSAQKDNKCIVISMPATTTIVIFRSMTDIIYFLHILLQFRLAFVAPESRVVGAGEVVDHPKKIAYNYLCGYFIIDAFAVLPLPQILILLVIPKFLGSSTANYAKNLLRTSILAQYIPRLCRFLPLLAGQTPSGFIFQSAWANFVINLLTFMLSSHVVGSCWYLFGLQRINQCLRDACHSSGLKSCMRFIDCGRGDAIESFILDPTWNSWKSNENSSACFKEDGFSYGIYIKAVDLTTKDSIITRYVYSLFWGFQQISTLAGNLIPSYFVWEVLFTMAIIGLGLLLFALLIGNMQNFLQALGQRRSEMSLRHRDVERWMSHRCLPEELRRRVRKAERYNWAATRGVNEEILLENLPEDIQKDIRRHLFKFVKKVRIFAMMDDQIIDAFCERLKQKIYIEESKILYPGGLIEKMVFIIRGKVESIGEDGTTVPLSEGDVWGEELLIWCLEHYSVIKNGKEIGTAGPRLLSNRTVRCLTNVEAFVLRAADLEQVTGPFARFLQNPHVQGAIRYESPYWRVFAARRIQVAWKYYRKRLKRASISQSIHSSE